MMNKNSARRVFAGMMIVLFSLSVIVRAHPLADDDLLLQTQTPEMKKLPPVNWIRSRTIDVKHIALDLSFDWAKEQAIGSEVITLAPFDDADKFSLDAAEMTIDSISLVGGGALKFNYDGKKDNDNLEILLGRIFPGGQDIKVKIDYKTHYVKT